MAIISTIEELQKYVRVNVSVMSKSFLPYVNDATDKYLRRYLGDDLVDDLETYCSSDDPNYPDWVNPLDPDDPDVESDFSEIFDKLLFLTRNALAKFALFLAAPAFDLHLTEMGFVVQQNQNTTPASAERVKKMVESLESQGYDNLETLLRFLEKHHSIITPYASSEAFALATNNLINSADVFDRYVNINASRLTFIKLRSAISDVEIIHVEPVISPELAAELRLEQLKGELSDDNQKLLLILQRAIANLVSARELNKPEGERYGNHYLAEAKKLIDKDPAKYPAYASSAQYVENKTGYALYENTEDSKTFSFGAH